MLTLEERKVLISLADSDAPVYQYKNKLGLNKDEVAYNVRMLAAHRQFVASHEEMMALRNKTVEPTPVAPIESLQDRLNKKVAELKKEMKKDDKV